jgi:hypothetical protein
LFADVITDKKLSVNGKQFTFDKDYSFTTAVPAGTWNVNNVVFAGYGIVDSAKGIDDYKGLDVRGKVVVVVDGGTAAPAGGQGRGGFGVNPKQAAATARGAVALLTVFSNFPTHNAYSVERPCIYDKKQCYFLYCKHFC